MINMYEIYALIIQRQSKIKISEEKVILNSVIYLHENGSYISLYILLWFSVTEL